MSTLDELLDGVRVMIILRALGPEKTVERAEAAWAAGVPLIEVTIGAAAVGLGSAGDDPAVLAALAAS
jgi:2-keto-3-deoxy-6-phosphogluconate aldolase